MLGKKSIYSLAQFLILFPRDMQVLLGKHGMQFPGSTMLADIAISLQQAESDKVLHLLDDIGRTHGYLRNEVTPRYRFDERIGDLRLCLKLDGYRLQESTNAGLVKIDPSLPDAPFIEDDLVREIKNSQLDDTTKENVTESLRLSHDQFCASSPDYNACLTRSRIALETIAKGMTQTQKWGDAICALRKEDVITTKDEQFLISVYRWVSEGSHRHISEEEMALLGRRIILSCCWFLIKKNQS